MQLVFVLHCNINTLSARKKNICCSFFSLGLQKLKFMTEVIKRKDGRGRKPLPAKERKVFLRVGVKEKNRKHVAKLLAEIGKEFG